jgi:uncharacterized protein YkwD
MTPPALAALLAGSLALASATPAAAQSEGPAEVLAFHNQIRAAHCVPPLQWGPRLAEMAQAWANRCVFEHRVSDFGENLAQGTSGAYSPTEHVLGWYEEIGSYDFNSGRSVDGSPVGHFTQLVWRGTTHVGCGLAQCGGNDFLVCNYAPAGNSAMMGREAETYRQNVPPRCR